MLPKPHSNAEMGRVFGQINVVNIKLNNRMSVELVNAILKYQSWIEKRQYYKACYDYD